MAFNLTISAKEGSFEQQKISGGKMRSSIRTAE
jgi:hypothetical protein